MSEIPNPLDDVAARWGRLNALLASAAVVGVLALLTPDGSALPWVVAALGVVLAATSDEFATTPPSEVDETKRLFVEGQISQDEFEQRIDLLLDDRAQAIRDAVERVNGVGPATSASIAQEFDSVDDVRLATVDDLRAVHGIGDGIAGEIVDELGADVEQVAARNRAASETSSTAATDGGRE